MLTIQLIACAAMTGIIRMVQVAVYPLFLLVYWCHHMQTTRKQRTIYEPRSAKRMKPWNGLRFVLTD